MMRGRVEGGDGLRYWFCRGYGWGSGRGCGFKECVVDKRFDHVAIMLVVGVGGNEVVVKEILSVEGGNWVKYWRGRVRVRVGFFELLGFLCGTG